MKVIIFGKHFELEEMPDNQLLKMQRKLSDEIRRLEGCIDTVQGHFVGGDYLEPDGDTPPWFKTLCRAMDRHRVSLIAIEGEITRRAETPTLAEVFMEICAKKMAPDLYVRVESMARKQLGQAEVFMEAVTT